MRRAPEKLKNVFLAHGRLARGRLARGHVMARELERVLRGVQVAAHFPQSALVTRADRREVAPRRFERLAAERRTLLGNRRGGRAAVGEIHPALLHCSDCAHRREDEAYTNPGAPKIRNCKDLDYTILLIHLTTQEDVKRLWGTGEENLKKEID